MGKECTITRLAEERKCDCPECTIERVIAGIMINPAASDDHWVSPSGSNVWCTVGQLKEIIAEITRLNNENVRLTDTLDAVMADEWREISTLPKIKADSRSNDVLGCWPSGEMMVVYYHATVPIGWLDSECCEPCPTLPTHWMPLPDPPAAESVRP